MIVYVCMWFEDVLFYDVVWYDCILVCDVVVGVFNFVIIGGWCEDKFCWWGIWLKSVDWLGVIVEIK